MNWHTMKIEDVMKQVGSGPEGLTNAEATLRLNVQGANIFPEKKKRPAWILFLMQFKDFMILVLVTAAIISGFTGSIVDAIIILAIVLLNATVSFIQEYRAEKALIALKKLSEQHSTVIRANAPSIILSSQLVPGDIVLLEAGTVVPADLRISASHSLSVEESSLTGESAPVSKVSNALKKGDLPLGDRINMAYKGTLVTHGRGFGIVVATGLQTELGHIAALLQQKDNPTPLQKRMADFGRKLSYLILLVCIIIFGVGLLRGEAPLNMLLVAISLAVAAIPETLPALITIALAKGARGLVKKNALIRHLPAVETLGSVTFICSDKTGTLTQNKMKVVKVSSSPVPVNLNGNISLLDTAILLNHDLNHLGNGQWVGDPTEVALLEYIEEKYTAEQVQQYQEQFKRLAELPFDSDRKCMTTAHKYGNECIAFSKGAAESICSMLSEGENSREILMQADELARDGMRVLAYGYKIFDRIPEPFSSEKVEKNFQFAGLIGLLDPPREEVRKSIMECQTAGIRPVMITGDHRETAVTIAKSIGMLNPGDLAVTGTQLKRFTKKELDDKIERISVYARVSPEQKQDIVKALQEKNHFVAMTGDGINDAPSLKRADIGIAMGITGTDVSKEAADMILLDDNFATIVKAIKEGRRIFDNIRKFIKYIMTCNSAEIWIIFLAPLIGLPVPLLPVHILWINLVTDGLPGIALSTEKAEHNIMHRPPAKPGESLLAGGTGYHIIWVGLFMAFMVLGIQGWAIQQQNEHWQTMVFTSLSFMQLGHVFAVRSEKEFIFRKGLLSNLFLLGTILLTFGLQLCIIYFPFANEAFSTNPLSLKELFICMAASVIVFHAVELEKWIRK
ncbi:MAG: cation-translocating P-type ATPase [Chitinophagaceae bacterium]|nr:cation-translocating P-type ATPase [Chitinophagaceae bacterium]